MGRESQRVMRTRVYLARVRIDCDVTGYDGGAAAPPGSNRRGVTAQLERPRRGPEMS